MRPGQNHVDDCLDRILVAHPRMIGIQLTLRMGALALVVIVSAGCAAAGENAADPATTAAVVIPGPDGLHHQTVNVAMTGTVREGIADTTTWIFEVGEVHWQGTERIVEGGVSIEVSPLLQPGDSVELGNWRPLEPGAEYLVVASFVAAGPAYAGVGRWGADAILDPVIVEYIGELTRQGRPPLGEILLSGEQDTPQNRRTALVELLAERREYQNAIGRGEPAEPEPRLEAAFEFDDESACFVPCPFRRVAPTSTLLGPEQRLDAYLALSPGERQLGDPSSELPPGAGEALDLVPVSLIVLHAPQLAARYEAIGLLTSAGYVGPYLLSEEQQLVAIDDWRPRDGSVQVIGWRDSSATDHEVLADLPPIAESVLTADVPSGGTVLIDLRAGEEYTRIVAQDELLDLIEQYARPGTG